MSHRVQEPVFTPFLTEAQRIGSQSCAEARAQREERRRHRQVATQSCTCEITLIYSTELIRHRILMARTVEQQNEAAKDIQCDTCKATFLKTTREKAYV